MPSIRDIIRNNNATFYNSRTDAKVRIWPRLVSFLILSPAAAYIIQSNLTDFVGQINTISSILLGFAFTVLFYLAGIRDAAELPNDISLEARNRIERIEVISRELFYNVSYFVAVASASLAISIVVIAPESHGLWAKRSLLPTLRDLHVYAPLVIEVLALLIRSAFFFLVFEAAYTFARIVGRVNFLFEEKLVRKSAI